MQKRQPVWLRRLLWLCIASLALLGLIIGFGTVLRPSLQSRIFELLVWRAGHKDFYLPLEQANLDRSEVDPSAQMQQGYAVSSEQRDQRTIWTIGPKGGASENHVFYLHGGGYISTFNVAHWEFIGDLINRCRCTFTAPDYPLAPEHTVDAGFAFVRPLYDELVSRVGAENITIMGDSAGAGLGLALAMQLRDEGRAQPGQIILLSPWLDVTLSNPEIARTDPLDPMLNIPSLREAGAAWAGQHDLRDYLVSPIYGELQGLAPIVLYIGTHDLFIADAQRLRTLAAEANTELNYLEYPEMLHAWMLYSFLPEASDARRQIGEQLSAE